MKTNKKLSIEIMIFLVLTLCITNSVFAFAVSSPYYKENPLNVYPGDTTDLKLFLQNFAGNQNVTVKAMVSQGSDIIKLTDANTIYTIPFGTKSEVNLRVTVPESVEVGNSYPIEIMFLSVSNNNGQNSFGAGVGQKFNVTVIARPLPPTPAPFIKEEAAPEKSSPIMLYLAVGIVLVFLIIIWVYFMKRKNSSPQEKMSARKKSKK